LFLRSRPGALKPKLKTVVIEKLSHDGRGIARVEGKTVFVAGALPGETVELKFYHQKSRFDEAVCEKIILSSPDRAVPTCPHFSVCGGCSLQHLSPEKQREYKQTVLLEQFQHFGHVQPEITAPPVLDKAFGYRHRARLSVKYVEKLDMVHVGFREKIHPRWVTDTAVCSILHPMIGEKIQLLRELIAELEIKREIPQVEIAMGDKECALIFRHLKPIQQEDRTRLAAFGKQHGFWILLQASNLDNLEWLLPEKPQFLTYTLPRGVLTYTPVSEKQPVHREEETLVYFFSPAHFTQVNPYVNRQLIQRVLELLAPKPDETILDLFCGLGNFSLPLARYAGKVIGVEGGENMVFQAKYNADQNQIVNAEFYTADLFKPLNNHVWASQPYDKILLDPPRTGAQEIVQTIERWNPKSIVYVSCNPATLARDAGILVHQKGYRLIETGIADMFPHTAHVESVALFQLG